MGNWAHWKQVGYKDLMEMQWWPNENSIWFICVSHDDLAGGLKHALLTIFNDIWEHDPNDQQHFVNRILPFGCVKIAIENSNL